MLIVGTNETSVELADEVALRGKWGWKVTGLDRARVSRPATRRPRSCGGLPVLGCARDVAASPRRARANRVIVVSPIALRELVEVARSRRRGARSCRCCAGALRDLHRHGRCYRRRRAAHGDHALDGAALLRGRPSAGSTCSARSRCSWLPARSCWCGDRHRGSPTGSRSSTRRSGAARTSSRSRVYKLQHDGQGRREALGRGARRRRRPPHHAGRSVPAQGPHRRAAPAVQHPPGRHELHRAAGPSGLSSSRSSAARSPATGSGSTSSRESPDWLRSAAATRPRRSASSSTTSSTCIIRAWPWTSRSSPRPCVSFSPGRGAR